VERALLFIALAYVAYGALAFALQRKIVFPGTHLGPFREADIGSASDVQAVWLTGEGAGTEAWFLPGQGFASTGERPAMIFFHGNGEFIDDWLDLWTPLSNLGVGVLLVEYPGYGRSGGKPSEESLARAADAAYDWLADRDDVDSDRIVAMGRSLGGGVAASLATRRSVAGLILQSTFTSVGAMAMRAYWLPPFLALDRFDSREVLESYQGPVLILHGKRDRIVPHRHGVALASVAANAHLVSLECAHNDCPPSWPEFWSHVEDFLRSTGILGVEDADR
jgi:fermentation-respiration switch protein FrsA (DUF1100 family)